MDRPGKLEIRGANPRGSPPFFRLAAAQGGEGPAFGFGTRFRWVRVAEDFPIFSRRSLRYSGANCEREDEWHEFWLYG